MDPKNYLLEQVSTWSRRLASGDNPILLPTPGQEDIKSNLGPFHLRSELFLQISGGTQFTLPRESLVLKPGQALLIPPRVPHAELVVDTQDNPDKFVNIVLIVHGSTLYVHVAGSDTNHQPFVRHPEHRDHADCLRLGAWLEDAAVSGSKGDVARKLVSAALERSAQLLASEQPASGREPPLVVMARSQVQKRLSDPDLSVARVAGALNCSADYLSHLFHRSTGLRLAEWINELRLGRAAELLVSTALSSKETAWACGFANQSYFIRLFRQRYGSSPQEYRQSLQ